MKTAPKYKSAPRYKTVPKSLEELRQRVIKIINFGWARYQWASNKDGYSVLVTSSSAIKFCLSGAITRADPMCNDEIKMQFRDKLRIWLSMYKGAYSIMYYNDSKAKSKQDIIKVLKELPLK